MPWEWALLNSCGNHGIKLLSEIIYQTYHICNTLPRGRILHSNVLRLMNTNIIGAENTAHFPRERILNKSYLLKYHLWWNFSLTRLIASHYFPPWPRNLCIINKQLKTCLPSNLALQISKGSHVVMADLHTATWFSSSPDSFRDEASTPPPPQ